MTVTIEYINACGRIETGYTTKKELDEAMHGEKSFIFFTDDEDDIQNDEIKYGWTLDIFDVIKAL